MFKKTILRYRIPRSNRKNSDLRNSVNFSEAKSIGIIFSSDSLERHKAVKDLVSSLESENKRVEVLTYLGKGKDNHEFLFNYFTKKDFSSWGKVENQHITSFLKENFDFVYCLDFELNLYMRYLLAQCKAKCRIGSYSEENSLFFELMVKPSEKNARSLIDSMKHYSRSLN